MYCFARIEQTHIVTEEGTEIRAFFNLNFLNVVQIRRSRVSWVSLDYKSCTSGAGQFLTYTTSELQECRKNGHWHLLRIWPSANITQAAKLMAT
jgi:hypothetical protein